MEDDDLEELKLIFLDECLENIELLENGLMRMGEGESDPEVLNEVFRAAHSIKGGAATFGYLPMSELTHHMETLLDEMRSGRREVADDDVDLLLESLDVVRSILEIARDSNEADHDNRLSLQQQLEKSVLEGIAAQVSAGDAGGDVPADEAVAEKVPASAAASPANWHLQFTPNANFYKRGHEPVLLLRALGALGELDATVNVADFDDWDALDPTDCHLAWSIALPGTIDEAAITDVFCWVDTDCTLELTRSQGQTQAHADTPGEVPGDVSDETAATDVETAMPLTPEPDQAPPSPAVPSAAAASTGAASPAGAGNKGAAEKSRDGAAGQRAGKSGSESGSIRIATEKIDQLINLVGELVITQSMLSRVGDQDARSMDIDELRDRLAELEHNTRELQESVMQVRMLPLSSAFSRLPRLVRDLSKKLGKQVDLVFEGGSTELDKTVLERMIDPLVHLVRNSLDHGLEIPEKRVAAGKPATGRLELSARQESGSVIIQIIDDGAGIDQGKILAKAMERGIVQPEEQLSEEQILQLIFAPGFSTAETVSDVSGRGVGMDVVRRNILDLGGRVRVRSELGRGTIIDINLPLSLAILDGQLVSIGEQVFVIPILSIVETLEMTQAERSSLAGSADVFLFRGEYLAMVDLRHEFGIFGDAEDKLIVVVETHGRRIGLIVEQVLGQQQVVIKPLEKNYKAVPGLAGATIMSDGSVALIIDPSSLSLTMEQAA